MLHSSPISNLKSFNFKLIQIDSRSLLCSLVLVFSCTGVFGQGSRLSYGDSKEISERGLSHILEELGSSEGIPRTKNEVRSMTKMEYLIDLSFTYWVYHFLQSSKNYGARNNIALGFFNNSMAFQREFESIAGTKRSHFNHLIALDKYDKVHSSKPSSQDEKFAYVYYNLMPDLFQNLLKRFDQQYGGLRSLAFSLPPTIFMTPNTRGLFSTVQSSLRIDEALVKFFSFSPVEFDDLNYIDAEKDIYGAFIVKKGFSYPHLIIFNDRIAELGTEYFDKLKSDYWSDRSSSISVNHFSNFFEPLLPYLSDVETLIIETEGVFDNIPFQSLLIDGDKKEFLMDRFKIRRKTSFEYSGNNEIQDKSLTNLRITLFDDPAYSNLGKYSRIPPLYSGSESLSKDLSKISGISITQYRGNHATEENLRTSLRNAVVLHINTHKDVLHPDLFSYDNYPVSENLGLNVLYLQGAEDFLINGGKIHADSLDGVLNGFEIGEFNLKNNELVVLSACSGYVDLGWGKTDNYGIVEAFQNAGAKKIIANLWPVNSNITRKFFTQFYAKLLVSNDIFLAFNHAKLELRKQWPHPYFWGSFILVE